MIDLWWAGHGIIERNRWIDDTHPIPAGSVPWIPWIHTLTTIIIRARAPCAPKFRIIISHVAIGFNVIVLMGFAKHQGDSIFFSDSILTAKQTQTLFWNDKGKPACCDSGRTPSWRRRLPTMLQGGPPQMTWGPCAGGADPSAMLRLVAVKSKSWKVLRSRRSHQCKKTSWLITQDCLDHLAAWTSQKLRNIFKRHAQRQR